MNEVNPSNNLVDLTISYYTTKCIKVRSNAKMERFLDLLGLDDAENGLRKIDAIVIYVGGSWSGGVNVSDSIWVECSVNKINQAYFMSGKDDRVIKGIKVLSSGICIIELAIKGGSYIVFEVVFLDSKALSILVKAESSRARDIIKYKKEFFRIRLSKIGLRVVSFNIVK